MKSPVEVSLEQAAEADAEELANISKRAFHSDVDVGAPGKEGGPPGYDSPEFQVRLMKWCDYYKILYDGQLVGGFIISKKGPGHYECSRIFVDPEFQNRGVATRSFELVWTRYPDQKIWTLGTPEWNVRTKHFYEKIGFVQIGWTRDEPDWQGRYYEKIMVAPHSYKRLKISDLRSGMKNVELEAQVQTIPEPKQVSSRKTGEPLRVAHALIQDDTGSITLNLWNEQIQQVKAKERIRIEDGYVTTYRGMIQLSLKSIPLIILL